MQTFLPYVDFKHSVQVLDRQRLGKQRLEAWQILNVLHGRGDAKGFTNHPAVLMWKGCERALLEYAFIACFEWAGRGYEDNMRARLNGEYMRLISEPYKRPNWLGDQRIHASHRAALLYKMPDHYKQYGWKEEAALNYFWPSSTEIEASDATVTSENAT